jgi:hypothetical protein
MRPAHKSVQAGYQCSGAGLLMQDEVMRRATVLMYAQTCGSDVGPDLAAAAAAATGLHRLHWRIADG